MLSFRIGSNLIIDRHVMVRENILGSLSLSHYRVRNLRESADAADDLTRGLCFVRSFVRSGPISLQLQRRNPPKWRAMATSAFEFLNSSNKSRMTLLLSNASFEDRYDLRSLEASLCAASPKT